MHILDSVDKDIRRFYKKSINALAKLEKRPSEKQWNKLAKKNFYMTSISLKRYSGFNSWILLCLNAKRLSNKNN